MKELADHLEAFRDLAPRVVYTDLDGTLLGPGGSLFATDRGGVTLEAAEALSALHRAEIAVVPISGRTAPQVIETARVIGARDFVAELGGITVYGLGEETVRDHGAYRGGGTPHNAMFRDGVPGMLMDAFPGTLEPHAPWAFMPRESSMLFRGHVSLEEAREALTAAGYGWLDLLDNGVIPRAYPALEVEEVHAYHLLPKGVTKASAAAADLARRGVDRERAIAVGDSPSDAALAEAVGTVCIVANGRLAVEAEGHETAFATTASYGAGFAEVARAFLRD